MPNHAVKKPNTAADDAPTTGVMANVTDIVAA
jgi:hypothetical protein